MKYFSIKNTHFFFPFTFPWIYKKKKKIVYDVIFDESCRYIFGKGDQHDWNKGGGLSFDLFTNHKDSVRWVWRYQPATDRIELTSYVYRTNEDSSVEKIVGLNSNLDDKVSREATTTVSFGEKITIEIEISYDKKEYKIFFIKDFISNNTTPTNVFTFNTVPFTHNKTISRNSGLYFGGNKKSPKKMKINIKKRKNLKNIKATQAK
jgi:hypothetical protein